MVLFSTHDCEIAHLKAYGQLKEEGLEILCGLEISKLAGALAYEHMAQPTLLGG